MRPSPVHGTTGYSRFGCRCVICTTANRVRGEKMRAQLKALTQAGSDRVPHGTKGGYTNWSCRCDACTRANTVACLRWRHANGNGSDA